MMVVVVMMVMVGPNGRAVKIVLFFARDNIIIIGESRNLVVGGINASSSGGEARVATGANVGG